MSLNLYPPLALLNSVQAYQHWVRPLDLARSIYSQNDRFSAPDVRLSRLPGWEKNSWGYHADDGWAFPGHREGNSYGPTFDSTLFLSISSPG